MRARAWILGAAVLVAAGAAAVFASGRDGTLVVRGAMVGAAAAFRVPDFGTPIPPAWVPRWIARSPWARPLFETSLGFSLPHEEESGLFVHASRAAGLPADCSIAGECGCRWRVTASQQAETDAVAVFPRFPRRSSSWDFTAGPFGPVNIRNPSVLPPAPEDARAEPLPLAVRVGDETWTLVALHDERMLSVGPADASGRSFEWTYRHGRLRDASGNSLARTPSVGLQRSQKIWLPSGDDAFHLCPHEPWWELTLRIDDTKTVTFRFAPPVR